MNEELDLSAEEAAEGPIGVTAILDTAIEGPKVTWGVSSTLGVISTIAAAAGTTYAAIQANDTATITAGVATIATALTTLGGRFAQAVALVRRYEPIATQVASDVDAGLQGARK